MRRREQTVVGWVALLFVLGLIGVNAVWPQGFVVFIAIGGTVGALMVLYEVRLTKQIAQAEFIRDLQTSFTSDPNITALWRKLLLGEEIRAEDRPLMSSYLTFFETIHLLEEKGALDLAIVDDLFRNRFFTAIGHPVLLRHTLVRSVGAFTNIHRLIAVWYEHLLRHRKPIHTGYYSYIRAVMEAKGFELVELDRSHVEAVTDLQRRVLTELREPWLRENSTEMFEECLRSVRETEPRTEATTDDDPQHHALGAMKDGTLVAAAILYDPGVGAESIKRYFTNDENQVRRAINLKLVLADPEHRRHRLGATLVKLLEQRATDLGRGEILCTIHPKNTPSSRLFRGLGYRRVGRVATSYGQRAVYGRNLQSIDAHWIR